jgi:diaminopimelate epimerase
MPNKVLIPFVKMHGLGNDFVIVKNSDISNKLSHKQLAINISDRRLGIGCDQFIIYEQNGAQIKMTIFNGDGSLALACGNASRCLSKLIFDNSGHKEITIHVGKRQVMCQYHNNNMISVNMGPVSFTENWMPPQSQLWPLAQQYGIEPKEIICADVANPHLVIFSKSSEADQELIGQSFQKSDVFPNGVNINFVEIDGDNIKLRVWERGTGFTYACGSGAVASFAAANKFNFVQNKALILFELGNLLMQKQDDNITMTGPASFVFKGDFHYE